MRFCLTSPTERSTLFRTKTQLVLPLASDAARAVTGSHRAAEDASNSVGEVVEAILGSLDELEMLIGVAKGEFKEESFQLPASRFVECPLGKAQRVCTSQVCVHRLTSFTIIHHRSPSFNRRSHRSSSNMPVTSVSTCVFYDSKMKSLLGVFYRRISPTTRIPRKDDNCTSAFTTRLRVARRFPMRISSLAKLRASNAILHCRASRH